MSFTDIEAAYDRYLEIEPYLSDKERLNYLKGFQELIKLFKLNVSLEDIAEVL